MNRSRIHTGVVAALLATAVFAAICSPAVADEQETLQRATDKAVEKLSAELKGTNFPNVKNVAVLPLQDDPEGYATTVLKSAVTESPYGLFTRSDEDWEKLLAEIEWGDLRGDIMTPKTVQKFGKIQGVDAILYGRVWLQNVNMWSIRAHTKISVHLADVETGQILWSSKPTEGEAYMHWSDALMNFWRYPLVIVGGLVALIIVLMIFRGIKRAISHAARPL